MNDVNNIGKVLGISTVLERFIVRLPYWYQSDREVGKVAHAYTLTNYKRAKSITTRCDRWALKWLAPAGGSVQLRGAAGAGNLGGYSAARDSVAILLKF